MAPSLSLVAEFAKDLWMLPEIAEITCILQGSISVLNAVSTTITKTTCQTDVVSHVLLKEWSRFL